MGVDLQALARTVRKHPGVTAKAEIGLVSEVFQGTDWLAGPGDDGAVVTDQGVSLVVGGEAILPSFVAADPYGAGVAAVTTNLNDLAAMGANVMDPRRRRPALDIARHTTAAALAAAEEHPQVA